MSRRDIEVIARGALFHGEHVLACRNVERGYLYLPGGHVEFGEPAAAALAREFLEESGLTVRVGPLLLATENIFESGGKRRHEINLVFHVEHPDPPAAVGSLEPAIAFDWLDPRLRVDLRPGAILEWLRSNPSPAGIPWRSEVR